MLASIFGLILVLLGLLALALQRFYSCVPAKELKRLAARGDHLAQSLYRPVAYGPSMRLLLWMIMGISLPAGYLLIMYSFVAWFAWVLIALSVAGIIWLQSVRLNVHSARLAAYISVPLNAILQHIHRPLDMVTHLIHSYREHTGHSGMYEKEDLLALIHQQKEQVDNRIAHADLELMERAASFDDRQAADIVMPWNKIKLVKTDDSLGPILLQELHDSGQTSFLVYEGKPNHIVGTLFLRDAVHAKAGGQVASLMHPRVCFVHEDFNLRQVLHAFAQTGQFMVVVINAFEEAVGVITLQHLLIQLVGEISAEDMVYEDRKSVAAFKPQMQPAEEPIIDEVPEQPSPEPTESKEE